MIDPIIKDLHPKFDVKYSYKFDEFNLIGVEAKLKQMRRELEKMESIQIKMRRNFKNIPFTPLMSKECKI